MRKTPSPPGGTQVQPGPAKLGPERYRFNLWAPNCNKVYLELLEKNCRGEPVVARSQTMDRLPRGWWSAEADGLDDGGLYRYRLDRNLTRPDPASHSQPMDVHGPSALVDHEAFVWQVRDFRPPPLDELVLYELHLGTFTPEGTCDAACARLDDLVHLGVNAVELMPVAQFPGSRNWGYDGAYPYAVQRSYGGPESFKRFVDACHARGLAVLLDVVYNHLGPEGNYLGDCGPYFTDHYTTPWGRAVNFDGPDSDAVRDFFLHNALHWYRHYRVDGLRLDAVHAIFDARPLHFLAELAQETRRFEAAAGRPILLIAESDRNDPRLVLPPERGGYGLDAVWSDDFHHSLHALLTGESAGYYQDYGSVEHLALSLGQGFAYQGQYSAFHRRGHGADASRLSGAAHVICCQNHDQTGNRMLGERLAALVPFEALKVAAGLLLFAPATPLLFMGEEYGETRPFLYFISHLDQKLVAAVRKGRRLEFNHPSRKGGPPDPQDPGTMKRCILDWERRNSPDQRELLEFHRECLRLRRALPPLRTRAKAWTRTWPDNELRTLAMLRSQGQCHALCLCNLHPDAERSFSLAAYGPAGSWDKILDSSDTTWGGPGALPAPEGQALLRPLSLALFSLQECAP